MHRTNLMNTPSEPGSAWMLFRQVDGPDDPVAHFNQNLFDLAEAEVFQSEQELNKFMAKKTIIGMPYTLEVGLSKPVLVQMIEEGKFKQIAQAIKKMNAKNVEYDGAKFSYLSSDLSLGK